MPVAQPRNRRRIPCSACPLRDCGAFRELDDRELAFVEEFKSGEFQIEAGTVLLEEDNDSPHLYTVMDGWGFRHKALEDGRRQILNYALPGDLVGLQSAMFQKMEHSVEALTDMTLCVFERKRFFELYTDYSELAFDITWLAAREERMVDDHLLNVGRRSAQERIGYIILHLYDRLERIGKARKGELAMPLTQQHLADTLGLSLVHTNRSLNALIKSGLISWENNVCVIKDRDELVELTHYEGADPRTLRPLI